MKRVKRGGKAYVVREGKLIEIVSINPGIAPEKKRRTFEPRFVKFPRHWVSALGQTKSVNTYRLAMPYLPMWRDGCRVTPKQERQES
jgi:hypothetical protein